MSTIGTRWLAGTLTMAACATGTTPAVQTLGVSPGRLPAAAAEAAAQSPSRSDSAAIGSRALQGIGTPMVGTVGAGTVEPAGRPVVDDEVVNAVEVHSCGLTDAHEQAYLAGGGRVVEGGDAEARTAAGSDEGLVHCARTGGTWLFVGRDGAVYTAQDFLGALSRTGGAPLGPVAEVLSQDDTVVARTVAGSLFVLDSHGASPARDAPSRVFSLTRGEDGLLVALAEPALVAYSTDVGRTWSIAATPRGTAPVEATRGHGGAVVRFADRTLALRSNGRWSPVTPQASLGMGGGPREETTASARAHVAMEALSAGVVTPPSRTEAPAQGPGSWHCRDTDALTSWVERTEFAYRMPNGAVRLGQTTADGQAVAVEYWLGALEGRRGQHVTSTLPLPAQGGAAAADDVAVEVLDAEHGDGFVRLCGGATHRCTEALLTPAGALPVHPTLGEFLHDRVDVLQVVRRDGGGAEILVGSASSPGVYHLVDVGHDGAVRGQVAGVARLPDTHPAVIRDGGRAALGLVTASGTELTLQSGRWIGGGTLRPGPLASGPLAACSSSTGREVVVQGIHGAEWVFGQATAPTTLVGAQSLSLRMRTSGACVSALESHAHNQWTMLRPRQGTWRGTRGMGSILASIQCDTVPRDPAGD